MQILIDDMKKRGLSHKEVAEAACISVYKLKKALSGDKNIKISVMRDIAEVLGFEFTLTLEVGDD